MTLTKINPKACRNCTASHRDETGLYCRFNPPTVGFFTIDGKPVQVTNFPRVEPEAWCMKHTRLAVYDDRDMDRLPSMNVSQ
jgi:hypothetical protein